MRRNGDDGQHAPERLENHNESSIAETRPNLESLLQARTRVRYLLQESGCSEKGSVTGIASTTHR